MPIVHEYVVISVTFNQEGAMEIEWTDAAEHDEMGGTFVRTQITAEAMEAYPRVGYYANELRQDVDELLYAFLKERKVGLQVSPADS